jgi:transketolase
MWSRLGPSGTLGTAAIELGNLYDNVLFLTADMTFAAGLERFRNKYPDRIYNFGIAEQNLIGAAAGLASEGFDPFAVTYAAFLATRALDQVKVNLGYMKQPVKLIGLNAGFAAGILGPTHMALEDISALRSIPNMTIVAPADMTEVCKSIIAAAEFNGPMFIRLTGEMNQPQVYTEDYDFQIGKSIVLREGGDVSIISCGTVVYNCCQAASRLEEQGIRTGVVNMHTIKPLDTETLESVLGSRLVVTVEEHNVYGGLGSAVAEYLVDKSNAPKLCRIGVNDRYPHAGSYQTLLRECGLDAENIEKTIVEQYKEVAE